MLEGGNGGMTTDEYKTHMSLWCILAARLLAGNDLTRMDPRPWRFSPTVIPVDQHPAGVRGHRVAQEGELEVWMKPLADGSKAIGLFNRGWRATPITVEFPDLGISGTGTVRDQCARRFLGAFTGSFTATVPKHGVVMIKEK